MFLPHTMHFLKTNRGLELVSLPHFLHNFWSKIFLLIYSINWSSFIVWLFLICEILGNMFIAIVCLPGCDIINFETNLTSLVKPWFLHDQKVMIKTWERRELLRWNKINFIIFKGLWKKQITQIICLQQ